MAWVTAVTAGYDSYYFENCFFYYFVSRCAVLLRNTFDTPFIAVVICSLYFYYFLQLNGSLIGESCIPAELPRIVAAS